MNKEKIIKQAVRSVVLELRHDNNDDHVKHFLSSILNGLKVSCKKIKSQSKRGVEISDIEMSLDITYNQDNNKYDMKSLYEIYHNDKCLKIELHHTAITANNDAKNQLEIESGCKEFRKITKQLVEIKDWTPILEYIENNNHLLDKNTAKIFKPLNYFFSSIDLTNDKNPEYYVMYD